MRQSDSVDGITNFTNTRDKLNFNTRHLALVPVDRRGTTSPPRRNRVKPSHTRATQHSGPEETQALSVPLDTRQHKKADLQEGLPQKKIQKRRFWQHRNIQKKILVAMASIVFICGMAVTGYGIYVNRQVAAVDSSSQDPAVRTIANPGEDPSEEPISDQEKWNYTVPADHPRLLMVPKLWLTARVVNLGVDEYGNLEAPYSVWDTGWYRDSAKPGSKFGATLIDGHVSGLYGRGVFHQLGSLNKGDEIIIELGSGEQVKYKVATKETFKKDEVDMKKAVKSVDITKHGLNLITCDGEYISDERTFSHRLLLRAIKID